jgi:hypothetical protein
VAILILIVDILILVDILIIMDIIIQVRLLTIKMIKLIYQDETRITPIDIIIQVQLLIIIMQVILIKMDTIKLVVMFGYQIIQTDIIVISLILRHIRQKPIILIIHILMLMPIHTPMHMLIDIIIIIQEGLEPIITG